MSKYRDVPADDEGEYPQPLPTSSRVTPASIRRQNLNPLPESEVELNGVLLTPQNGRASLGKELDEMYKIKHPDGSINSAWDYFTAQTSDTRLSNLRNDLEIRFVRWSLEVQGKALIMKLPKAAATADFYRTTVCEPGLARDGFLRNNIQTVHTKNENINVEHNEKSRNLFGKILGGK